MAAPALAAGVLRPPTDGPDAVLIQFQSLEVDMVDIDAAEPFGAAARLPLCLGNRRGQVTNCESDAVGRLVFDNALLVFANHADGGPAQHNTLPFLGRE